MSILKLKASVFKRADFLSTRNCGCVMELSLRKLLPNTIIKEAVYLVSIKDRKYNHDAFGVEEFLEAERKAIAAKYDKDTIVARINIPGLKLPKH